jgi:hypothetical protein
MNVVNMLRPVDLWGEGGLNGPSNSTAKDIAKRGLAAIEDGIIYGLQELGLTALICTLVEPVDQDGGGKQVGGHLFARAQSLDWFNQEGYHLGLKRLCE